MADIFVQLGSVCNRPISVDLVIFRAILVLLSLNCDFCDFCDFCDKISDEK